tara:strand:- start:1549 stop:2574 length:1026 start_codon:yes stop_codon:yes gene_type:complete
MTNDISRILVTGGAGYIGSHTVLCLLQKGYEVSTLDNLSNGSIESLSRIQSITGKSVENYEIDITDKISVSKIFKENSFDAIIHFAGLKAVGRSVIDPFSYYQNNVVGSLVLLEQAIINKVKKFIFSSSATVYGRDAVPPYLESMPKGITTNPYGSSKAMIERILEDLSLVNSDVSFNILRYFNPIGAHSSGLIGEDPLGESDNLMPFILQVAVGEKDVLSVFGGDYDTPDGTCRRDYLHVMDLAEGHVSALSKDNEPGCFIYNLGTGVPISVLEIVNTFESVTGITIPYKIVNRRKGDLAEFWADPKKANIELDWRASRSLNDMISDAWNWQSKNPSGYK